MARKLIDLSMLVHNDMIGFPQVVRPSMVMYESWTEFAEASGPCSNARSSGKRIA
jgi:hypothetical protein